MFSYQRAKKETAGFSPAVPLLKPFGLINISGTRVQTDRVARVNISNTKFYAVGT